MDSKHAEQLLEKYWNCETSLEEEQQLRAYFRTNDIPASMKDTAELFRYFDQESGRSVGKDFDGAVTKELRTFLVRI